MRDLVHLPAFGIADVDLLFSRAITDENNAAGGEPRLSRDRVDDIIGQCLDIFVDPGRRVAALEDLLAGRIPQGSGDTTSDGGAVEAEFPLLSRRGDVKLARGQQLFTQGFLGTGTRAAGEGAQAQSRQLVCGLCGLRLSTEAGDDVQQAACLAQKPFRVDLGARDGSQGQAEKKRAAVHAGVLRQEKEVEFQIVARFVEI